jgi:type I restriction enzyme M protein
MIGAIVGDIVGSRFEWNNIKTKIFTLFTPQCHFTDDSVMSLAICQALLQHMKGTELSDAAVVQMQTIGRKYPDCGYGGTFFRWLQLDEPVPYHSWGNGAAMRVSGCGWAANSVDEAINLADAVTRVTHNHPEGMKGAEATATAVFLARTGKSMEEIRAYMEEYFYCVDFTLSEIRASYAFDESCQGTVPQALAAFYESTDFEDAIRNAISIGGDSDTIAAITGAIAGAYYGVPDTVRRQAMTFLDEPLTEILQEFERCFPAKREVSTC